MSSKIHRAVTGYRLSLKASCRIELEEPMTTATPFSVHAGEGPYFWNHGHMVRFAAIGSQTDGRFFLAELFSPQGSSGPLHRHAREDETFMVVEGDIAVRVGDQTLELGPGDIAYNPRGVPHSWDAKSQARFFIMGTPAGFEGYFFEFCPRVTDPSAAPLAGWDEQEPDPAAAAAALAKYGAELL